MVQDRDDEIIELTQVVGQESFNETDQQVIELIDIHTEDNSNEGLAEKGLELQEHVKDEVLADVPLLDFSQNQLDAALERVIEKKFSDTIEKILFEVMERVIQKEIKEIKEGLQKDLDDIGSA